MASTKKGTGGQPMAGSSGAQHLAMDTADSALWRDRVNKESHAQKAWVANHWPPSAHFTGVEKELESYTHKITQPPPKWAARWLTREHATAATVEEDGTPKAAKYANRDITDLPRKKRTKDQRMQDLKLLKANSQYRKDRRKELTERKECLNELEFSASRRVYEVMRERYEQGAARPAQEGTQTENEYGPKSRMQEPDFGGLREWENSRLTKTERLLQKYQARPRKQMPPTEGAEVGWDWSRNAPLADCPLPGGSYLDASGANRSVSITPTERLEDCTPSPFAGTAVTSLRTRIGQHQQLEESTNRPVPVAWDRKLFTGQARASANRKPKPATGLRALEAKAGPPQRKKASF